MKQTAVEWLVDELKDHGIDYDITEIVQQALKIEKLQHEVTFLQSLRSNYQTFEQYYKETYGD